MTTRAIAQVALLGFLVGACGSEVIVGPAPTPPPAGAVVVAARIAFDRPEIDVPAGRPFDLLFQNRDAIPHNVTIATADGAPVYVGEIFSGPDTKTYGVPALAAGRYAFRCDVHPLSMVGEVNAG